jgi:dephospho-CoA kinase
MCRERYRAAVLIVGLTGGIGSGKSTVAHLLAERGVVVIDVDALGRTVIAPGGRAEAAVIEAFGPGIVDHAGHIDRGALGRAVFARPDELARLTAISHPAINAELADRLDALPDDAIVVLDMAILVESNLGRGDPAHSYSRVIAVEAPVGLRVERAVARGMAEADVRNRVAAQATDEERRAVADVVIVNDGDLSQLAARVDEAWTHLLSG